MVIRSSVGNIKNKENKIEKKIQGVPVYLLIVISS